MIEASFDRERGAAASGAYQYDTGQRLRMHGLPSPGELALEDEFLSGDMITMQVHFGFKGDSQTQARLALWDEASRCYLAAIPDEYLQTAESVYAYVYVSHGLDTSGNGRTKTMYELTFRPAARPAPDNVATDAQWEAWAVKQEELQECVNRIVSAGQSAQTAVQDTRVAAEEAQQAAKKAETAAGSAQQEAQRLEAIESRWAKMTVHTTTLAAGEQATAAISGGVLTLGIPKGARGAKGATGDAGPADITITLADGILTITPKG